MPWFWGNSEEDSEYESDEYTDGEYSDEEYEEYTDEEAEEEEEGEVEEAAVEEEEDKEEKDEVTKEEEEVDDGDDEKKEMDEEPAAVTEEADEKDSNKEDEEESYVEVTKEDAASPKAANDQADEEPAEEKEEEKDMRSNSLLDAASVDEVEETSSIVEEERREEVAEEPKDTTTPEETKVVVENPPPPADEVVQVETVSSDEGSVFSDTTDEEDEELTSFADKQSMLLLAAEHDRVDILKAILTDEEDVNIDKNALMNTGIPPLHVAISFGSTNTTSSLLRMGADPSIRPNLDEVQKHYVSHQSKVEIKNMGRFDGISAWELAFGNAAYAKLEASGGTKRSSWVFGSAIQPVDDDSGERIIGPLDSIPEAKRAGIQHAFTAEALRCLGGDELDRLKQLVDSGMPATTEIAEKDLYQWAVEMGALQCEEYLRPVEAAKHANESEAKEGEKGAAEAKPAETSEEDTKASSISNARVLDRSRPGEDESPSQLRNKLVELDSLATALSTCVDNLAEEVSVCHGLLMMNGGASALASHVKSLKQQKADREDELSSAYIELETLEERLAAVVQAAGPVGNQVMGLSEAELKQQEEKKKTTSNKNDDESEDSKTERFELLDKIAASENKIRKLRISIADLSEESARDLQEVERRGLSGGIDLVRGLRDEIRDVEFQLAETKSLMATFQTKIRLIRAKVSPETELPTTPPAAAPVPQPFDDVIEPVEETEKGSSGAPKTASQKIATGDSQAIAVRAPGKQGFFRIDLWQVILRIIGMNRAADRRAIEVMQRQRKEQMDKIAAGGFDKRPEPIHVMTV